MKNWYQEQCPTPSQEHTEQAVKRQATLTKPLGSLGRLEEIAVKFAGWQHTDKPTLDNVMVRVFAGDHGICDQNISAFPQQVTMQMVLNFIFGGAAIGVLCKQEQANFAVVNSGLATPLPTYDGILQHPKLINSPVSSGTKDFSIEAAMSTEEMEQALKLGKTVIDSHLVNNPKTQLFIGGEMGIGNTSSASAIYSAILAITPEKSCGPGTGLNVEGVSHKVKVIEKALNLHQLSPSSSIKKHDPLDLLCKVGGFEIAGLVGAYITAAQNQIPSLVDGFISTAAALLAVEISPSCRDWLFFSHQSAEPAHRLALEHLNAKPLLDMGMRLGEGSGAAMCISILKSALNLHQNMATFSEAEVAGKKA